MRKRRVFLLQFLVVFVLFSKNQHAQCIESSEKFIETAILLSRNMLILLSRNMLIYAVILHCNDVVRASQFCVCIRSAATNITHSKSSGFLDQKQCGNKRVCEIFVGLTRFCYFQSSPNAQHNNDTTNERSA